MKSTIVMFQGGKTTLDLVLAAQRRAAQSELAYTSVLALYAAAIDEFHFYKGSLFAKHHLVIEAAEEPALAAEEAIAPRSTAIPDPTVEVKPEDRLVEPK